MRALQLLGVFGKTLRLEQRLRYESAISHEVHGEMAQGPEL